MFYLIQRKPARGQILTSHVIDHFLGQLRGYLRVSQSPMCLHLRFKFDLDPSFSFTVPTVILELGYTAATAVCYPAPLPTPGFRLTECSNS
jgi:hypothetical protein